MDSKYNQLNFENDLQERVYTSRLLGKEKSLVLHGGGNTSLKRDEKDHTGRQIRVLRVKGSGSDLSEITEKGFTGLRLDDLLAASKIDSMNDFEMADYLRKSMVDPSEPSPSVETFLHAFIPARFVDHSHSDAILALTNSGMQDDEIRNVLGSVIIFPYIPPGFKLARAVFDRVTSMPPETEGIVLRNHGLFTFGKSAKESYENHLRIVSRAEDFINERKKALDRAQSDGVSDFLSVIPEIRGKLSSLKRKIIILNRTREAVEIASSSQAERFASYGPATPDMLIRTKYDYCYVESPEKGLSAIDTYAAKYMEDYRSSGIAYPPHDPFPSIIVLKGYGILTAGISRKEASIVMDQFIHSFWVNHWAESIGGHRFLTKQQAFEMEYWPLEEAKLKKATPKKFQGHISIITGAASGIGYEVAKRLASEGSLVICCDIDPRIYEATAEISSSTGGETFPINVDISDETAIISSFTEILKEVGGVDNVFNNAGILKSANIDELDVSSLDAHYRINARGAFLVTREAFKIMKRQKIGGNFVFNISKNLTHPGPGMTAYGSSKAFAAQISRYVAREGGRYGIRSNIINPDKIFKGSKIWENGVLEARAKAKNQTVEEYKRSNLLQREVLPEHVAGVVSVLLDESIFGATTDAMIPIDGGIL